MKKLTEDTVDSYLKDLTTAFDRADSFWLRQLSNKLIEKAIILDNHKLANLSLIAYAFSKLTSKPHFTYLKKWPKFKKDMLVLFAIEKDKPHTTKSLEYLLEEVISAIQTFDQEAGNYISDVIEQARIKQGSRAYALGLTLSKAASLTGANKEALFSYIGVTKIHDRPFTVTKDLKDRYKTAREALEWLK